MATKATRNQTRKCECCNAYVEETKYHAHVVQCEKSDEDNEAEPTLKMCPLCKKQVKDLAEHCLKCTGGGTSTDQKYENQRRSPTPPVRQQPTTNGSNRSRTKECPICSETIATNDYEDHVDACEARSKPKPKSTKKTKECPICSETIATSDYEDHIDACEARSKQKSKSTKKTKECPICSKTIAANDYEDHLEECEARSKPKPKPAKKMKECPICSKTIAANDYEDHLEECEARSKPKPKPAKKMKECPMCWETIAANDYEDHLEECEAKSKPKAKPAKKTKECPMCWETIAANDYEDHLEECEARSKQKSKSMKKTKECPICSETIATSDYEDHVDACEARSKRKPKPAKKIKECPTCWVKIDANDYEDHIDRCGDKSSRTPTINKDTEECPICFNPVPKADYAKHVNACLERSSDNNKKLPAKSVQKSCFTCSSPVDQTKNSSHTIPCRARHMYCLKCLQRLMNEYIESNTVPVCHSTLCDYELSRYDIECLPLQPAIIQRLLTLVKSTQRPQCPFCLFYLDFNTMKDLEKHAASCNSENLIPCEYCHCLYNMHRLDEHSRQCRNDPPTQQRQALINFIVPRTKYPVTAQQMRVFLEHRKKSHLPLDPHSVVDALAEFDGAFPFDVPTRDCDVCAESYVYDDIFVFGCEQSHKLCYGCFADSCTTKMNGKEVLVCPMCPYQLQEGEIKQLRVPAEQKRQFVEYQIKKTLEVYASGQGVIRCPNKDCKWIAEMQNPNDRFQVECPLCGYQFCSLCSQQYHFRTTCQQLPELTQRWFFWCNTERGNYWQARAQHDANFRAQLEDYERQRAANTQRNQELRQRYDELLADETYKAQNCRLCPNCRRVVQHLSGCDLMVCGRNYHGGDDQSGCGHGFNFSQAPPYTPIGNTGPQQVTNNLAAPEEQKLVIHEGVQCDACQEAVQGIRFDCIHCASLTFCEKCEQRSTLEHSNAIRDQHKQQHVFQLITRP